MGFCGVLKKIFIFMELFQKITVLLFGNQMKTKKLKIKKQRSTHNEKDSRTHSCTHHALRSGSLRRRR
jgi:hypothetical protein